MREQKAKLVLRIKDDDEIQRILNFTSIDDCYRYLVEGSSEKANLESTLMVYDTILKVLPVILLSSIPLLFLAKFDDIISDIQNSNFNFLIASIITIVGLLLFLLVIKTLRREIKRKLILVDRKDTIAREILERMLKDEKFPKNIRDVYSSILGKIG